MSPIIRAWLCLAWAAAGLIHLALALGSPTAIAAVLGFLGLGEFVLALVIIASGRLPAPGALLVATLVPVGVWIAALLLPAAATAPTLQFVPLAIATLLELFTAAAIGVHLRRQRDGSPASAAPSTARLIVGIVSGVIVVTALSAPALVATQGAHTTSRDSIFTDDHNSH